MNHKQKSVRDYFLAALPNVNITLREEAYQLTFIVVIAANGLSHQIIFDRDAFARNSLRDLFNWLHSAELVQAMKHAVTPLKIIFKDNSFIVTDGTAQGLVA